MTDAPNLEDYGAACVYDAAYAMIGKELDLDDLREAARDGAYPAAENACTYTSWEVHIISRYDSEFGNSGDIDDSVTIKASEWEKGRSMYANALAVVVIGHYCEKALTNLEELRDTLDTECEKRGGETDSPVVSRDCPYGWLPHESETPEGVMYWAPAQAEGCHALAVKADCGLWLSYTWSAKRESV